VAPRRHELQRIPAWIPLETHQNRRPFWQYDRPVRRDRRPLLLALCAAMAGGCGSSDEGGIPAGCPVDAGQVVAALRAAPRPVRVHGLALSECMTRDSSGADVQRIGAVFVPAASRLSDQARREPRGPAALRLGYLVGAAERGAAHTGGLHSELVRRLEQELGNVGGATPEARRGQRAGRASG
jgi:hypothetical protein